MQTHVTGSLDYCALRVLRDSIFTGGNHPTKTARKVALTLIILSRKFGMPTLLGYYIGAPFRRLTFLRLARCITGAPSETQKPDPDVRPPLKTAGTEDRVAALVPPPCYRRNETRTRVLHPHCASRYHFPGRLRCSQIPCGQQDTLPFTPRTRGRQ
ncbi:hypothetical protein ARMGADRAFT_156818 [Armillaria gallica]|uniref:Uncharacterized protein n=1 Tax=Armillaria gallica TaxID=47427 RepID=A0A2H3DW31_ARMGA|nr:hypothetical protein ARMGADRAFT_156818 [Armillaria gallica]